MRWRCALLSLLALLPPLSAHAGLLADGTRVIYRAADRAGQRLTIVNTNPWPVLVQTWVDGGEGIPHDETAAFVVLPAVFRLEPSAIQSLHIMHTDTALAQDRESLFWLNLYEVPPGIPDAGQMVLQLTFNTQLKLLYRPPGIGTPDTLPEQLQFQLEQQAGDWVIRAHNPTPWHASFNALFVDGVDGPLLVDEVDLLLPPFATRDYRLQQGQPVDGAAVQFGLIGDDGVGRVIAP